MSELAVWRAYRNRRGSLNVGRRVEQAIGDLMAFYHNGEVEAEHRIDPIKLMPHEDQVVEQGIDLFDELVATAV